MRKSQKNFFHGFLLFNYYFNVNLLNSRLISQSREQINAIGCPLDFWDCNLNNLNTHRIIRKNRIKERGKIFPTEPRKPREKIRNTCEYHETCQDPPTQEKRNISALTAERLLVK